VHTQPKVAENAISWPFDAGSVMKRKVRLRADEVYVCVGGVH
jgi:hypothetical protein